MAALYIHKGNKRVPNKNDSMKSSYLGPEFHENQIEEYLKQNSDFQIIKLLRW